MSKANRQRCICGKSLSFPICDGSHQDEGWTCLQTNQAKVPLCVGSGSNLQNLALRLAHRFNAVLIDDAVEYRRVKKLVLLTDGTDIPELQAEIQGIKPQETWVIGVGLSAGLLEMAFPQCVVAVVPDEPLSAMWAALVRIIDEKSPLPDRALQSIPKVFVSHAVRDEGLIFPALTILRRDFGIPLFICADSIDMGSNWRTEIENQLYRCDVFLMLFSTAVSTSTYCAFESGVAFGLKKPIRIVKLDQAPLPAHLSDIQAFDVPRLLQRKPWLTSEDGVLEGCMSAIRL